jgi:hypothetical protein
MSRHIVLTIEDGDLALIGIAHISNPVGPFFVGIDKHASGHISPVRFAASGGPKPQEVPLSVAVPESVVASEQPEPPDGSAKQDKEELQRDFFKIPKSELENS